GVAPRAKMNQQRSRRFRAAKDAENSEAEEERLLKEFELKGRKVLPKQESEVSDSNIITPGTEFMYRLSQALEGYIRSRSNRDPGWKTIKVILSDANTPGEGEHKIMKFIRLQRNLKGYDPNTRHVLYGLDADLIMLALATHEIHFSILREDVIEEKKPSFILPSQTHLSKHNSDLFTMSEGCSNKWQSKNVSRKPYHRPYQFLNIWTLREYLELELKIPEVETDFERIIDDFIFICFFTGNDFLPHMPSLEIREGAIDLLMAVYKNEFKSRGGYLVNTEKQEEPYVQSPEDRLELNGRYNYGKDHTRNGPTLISDPRRAMDTISNNDVLKNTAELKKKIKDAMLKRSDLFEQGVLETDKVRLGMQGWKERYYQEKFSAGSTKDIEGIRKQIVEKYTEGLCWVLQYYFSGIRSWTWFYPYHHGPFASDLKGLGRIQISFNMGSPFKPFDQLMGVLPPRSFCALPKAYWHLLKSKELIDFYPNDFEVDLEGKRYLWQGIVKLPFIDEKRLLSETKKVESELEEDEIRRNSQRKEKIFVLSSHDFGLQVVSLYKKNASTEPERLLIETSVSGGINGFISPCCEDPGLSDYTLNVIGMDIPLQDDVVCATYEYPDKHPHIPRLHEGVMIPEKTIKEAEILKEQLWHEYEGHRPPNIRLQIESRFRKGLNGGNSSSSSPVHAKEIYKAAGTGWSSGRGRGNVDTHHNSMLGPSGIGVPKTVKPSPSAETRYWSSGKGKSNVDTSWNSTPEPCRQFKSSYGSSSVGGTGSSWNQTSLSLRPMQALSGASTASTAKWVARGRGHTEPSRNPTTNSCSTNTQVDVGKRTPSSVGCGWAGPG
ncbi:5'-3' exoribonuclease, partial [Thalictrum thalictroides]